MTTKEAAKILRNGEMRVPEDSPPTEAKRVGTARVMGAEALELLHWLLRQMDGFDVSMYSTQGGYHVRVGRYGAIAQGHGETALDALRAAKEASGK